MKRALIETPEEQEIQTKRFQLEVDMHMVSETTEWPDDFLLIKRQRVDDSVAEVPPKLGPGVGDIVDVRSKIDKPSATPPITQSRSMEVWNRNTLSKPDQERVKMCECAWEKICENIVSGRFKARGNVTVFDEVRAMRDEGKAKSWAFDMPWFEDMVRQLAVHEEWIGRLPWTRPSHPALQLDSILRDVVGDGDADSAPPMNEACTCICLEPVLVIGESAQDTEVVQCGHCLAKFHTKCIEGSCPFCDHHHWDGSVGKPRTFKLHDLILQYEGVCELTRHYSPDYIRLGAIIDECNALSLRINTFIQQLGQQGSPDPAVVPQIRHFMRKLYRIQFDVSARPDMTTYGLSLVHLHRLAIQPQPQQPQHRPNQKPKFVFKSEVDPEASDGSRCLCSGAAAGLNLSLLGCSECQSLYHIACVALSSLDEAPEPFVCPLCLLKKGKCYGLADVRVRYHYDDPEEKDAKFVDVKACLDNCSRGMIRRALPPPVRTTINVRLLRFVPGTNPDIEDAESCLTLGGSSARFAK
ncbi:hypothetical protein FRC12_011926 [Ceratobasidium sp. 428]|nr:hypothetical protein FRC12_011926 [Ceratobasidium sp. 428]